MEYELSITVQMPFYEAFENALLRVNATKYPITYTRVTDNEQARNRVYEIKTNHLFTLFALGRIYERCINET